MKGEEPRKVATVVCSGVWVAGTPDAAASRGKGEEVAGDEEKMQRYTVNDHSL